MVTGLAPDNLGQDILTSDQPLVLKGLVAHWPAVQADPQAYIRRICRQGPVNAFVGRPQIKERFFYSDDLSGFNYDWQSQPDGDP